MLSVAFLVRAAIVAVVKQSLMVIVGVFLPVHFSNDQIDQHGFAALDLCEAHM
jgi:hypothetical protein